MSTQDPIKVFIGSGEASLLERKVAIYSLKKHTQRKLEIYVFNGTHNAIELNDQPPMPAPLSLELKYQNITEFSLYRFLIPQICNYQGKAIWIDSDTLCLTDIGQLFDTPLDDYDFLAKQEGYDHAQLPQWGLSVMLINCATTRFDLETYYAEMTQERYTYRDFTQMSSTFLTHHPFKIGALDPSWNVFDRFDASTKLIHYTNLYTQPWKFPRHPYGELWFEYFQSAQSAGLITPRDIELSLLRAYVRPDILQGNSPPLIQWRSLKNSFRRTVKKLLKSGR
jgi:lipopolysaccharide biosynthesis glycosyltransferase